MICVFDLLVGSLPLALVRQVCVEYREIRLRLAEAGQRGTGCVVRGPEDASNCPRAQRALSRSQKDWAATAGPTRPPNGDFHAKSLGVGVSVAGGGRGTRFNPSRPINQEKSVSPPSNVAEMPRGSNPAQPGPCRPNRCPAALSLDGLTRLTEKKVIGLAAVVLEDGVHLKYYVPPNKVGLTSPITHLVSTRQREEHATNYAMTTASGSSYLVSMCDESAGQVLRTFYGWKKWARAET
jgi:hypothetical protein